MMDVITENSRLESIEWRESMGKQYAFITVEDMGRKNEGFNPPKYKKYWGEAKFNDTESVRLIMQQGANWDNLP